MVAKGESTFTKLARNDASLDVFALVPIEHVSVREINFNDVIKDFTVVKVPSHFVVQTFIIYIFFK